MWPVLAALAVSIAPSHAATCDAKALGKALTDAPPNQSGAAYVALAGCDAAAAKAAAPEAFKKILAGDSGDSAVVAAIGAGAAETVRGWVNAQEPDDRSRTISKLGEKCDQAGVAGFFLDTQKALGEKFWTERWYRGLDDCREAGVQELLRARVAAPGSDRTLFFGVLEVFSRNLGNVAIPALEAIVKDQKDAEIATYLVSAFADAAGVGSTRGADPEAVKSAVVAINTVAPTLPVKAVDQARTTLLSLGAEPDADRLAVVRYKDAAQPQGGLLYGVVTTETATCKKGDTRITVHTARVAERGNTWPDQLGERVRDPVNTAMKLDLAASCKGTGAVENRTPTEPFKDAAAYDAWVQTSLEEIQKANPGVKIKVVAENPLSL